MTISPNVHTVKSLTKLKKKEKRNSGIWIFLVVVKKIDVNMVK